MELSAVLIDWYEQNKRTLPWRETKDPYKIWLSEVILQQTRVQQGLDYYLNFSETFPTVTELADAPSDTVMKMWQGLGYYSRARNMHSTAQWVKNERNSIFPSTYTELLKLKGVGEYTAAAIASMAFEEPVAVVDGNVYRVLARVFGIDSAIDSPKGKKEFAALAQSILDTRRPNLHNQAMMEFGALQCSPKSPDCSICPLAILCEARKSDSIARLPVKSKSLKQKSRYFYYLVIKNKNSVFLRKRQGKDIWNNLYEFPLIETEQASGLDSLSNSPSWLKWLPSNTYAVRSITPERKHVLSHQYIHHQFIEIDLIGEDGIESLQNEYFCILIPEIKNYAVPKPIERFINDKLA